MERSRRYGEVLDEEKTERIKFELHIMKTMGFPGYFLIVQDFINAAREQLDVSVGPGSWFGCRFGCGLLFGYYTD